MKHSNLFKTFFDFIMVLLLVMIYSVSATGILFHEIVGLIIFMFFSIHLFYNKKWIIQVSKKLSDKKINKKLKAMYIVDILLFFMFILAGISGILISKELFRLGIVFVWRYVHIFTVTFSLILLGMHIRLHGKMITNTVKKYIIIPKIIGKTLVVVLLFSIFGIGVYGINKLSNDRNISSEGNKIRGISILNLFKDTVNAKESIGSGHENGNGIFIKHQFEDKSDRSEHKEEEFNIFYVIITSMGYLSFIIICSIITYFIDNNIINKKNNCEK